MAATAPQWPLAPTALSAVAPSDTRVDLAWQDHSSDETGFRIERSLTGSFTDIDTLQTQRGRISGHIGDGTAGDLDARTGGGTIRVVR